MTLPDSHPLLASLLPILFWLTLGLALGMIVEAIRDAIAIIRD